MALLLLAGCDFPGQPNPADRPVREDEVVSFDVLFKTNCAGCHGADGKMGPAPPLNDPLFLAIVPDEELLMTITAGRPGTPMSAFARSKGGPLTEEQVKALAEGIKPRWQANEKPKGNLPPYEAPEDNGGDKKRGARVFDRACSTCHGDHGEGGMDGSVGAINEPAFLSLISDQALRRIVITGRPDLGMPNYAEDKSRPPGYKPLTPEEITDLVALLASWKKGSP